MKNLKKEARIFGRDLSITFFNSRYINVYTSTKLWSMVKVGNNKVLKK